MLGALVILHFDILNIFTKSPHFQAVGYCLLCYVEFGLTKVWETRRIKEHILGGKHK